MAEYCGWYARQVGVELVLYVCVLSVSVQLCVAALCCELKCSRGCVLVDCISTVGCCCDVVCAVVTKRGFVRLIAVSLWLAIVV